MEGSLSKLAVHYCNQEPSLSCSERFDSYDATTADNQLNVTWYANTVITKGNYYSTNTPDNGDHNFLCTDSHTAMGRTEQAFVSIRGIYMLSHVRKCLK